MESLQVMSARFDQDDFWDPSLYSLSHTGSIDYPGTYAGATLEAPLEAPYSFETTLPQRNSSSRSIRSDPPGTWAPTKQIWPSIDHVASPDIEPPKRAKVPLPPDPRPPTQRKARKPPSGEALERRRQQNRAAQLAFRERSKRQMEELRQELAQCVDFNRKMQDSVRGLLERADELKRDIEGILAVKMPITSLDPAMGEQRHAADSGTATPESEASLNVDDEVAVV